MKCVDQVKTGDWEGDDVVFKFVDCSEDSKMQSSVAREISALNHLHDQKVICMSLASQTRTPQLIESSQ